MPLSPFDNVGAPSEGRLAGVVDVAFCAFRRGDSGRGKDGRDRGFNAGLAALPGPTDWLSFEIIGVVAVTPAFSPRPPRLNVVKDGVVGVAGEELYDAAGDKRLYALLEGRNMPAPGIEVVKYRTLSIQIR